MWFDKFADWLVKQDIAAIGLVILLIVGFFLAIWQKAWGIWKTPDK